MVGGGEPALLFEGRASQVSSARPMNDIAHAPAVVLLTGRLQGVMLQTTQRLSDRWGLNDDRGKKIGCFW